MGVSLSQDIGNGLGTCTDGFLRSIQVDDVIFKVHIHNPAAVIFDRQFNEIQKGLIQLRSEAEGFSEKDQERVTEAWDSFSRLEDILSEIQHTGTLKPKSGSSPSS